jgi:methylmalonyl-CoA/ethylmalonyl-CoA epimerase
MSVTDFGLTFDHFGLAVGNIAGARKVLEGMGYECGEEVYDPLQEVLLVWCEHATMPAVEIVAPTDKPGPLDNIIVENSGSIYHLCYRAANIGASVAAIKAAGIRVLPVVPPKPAVLFGGKSVGFFQVKGFGLIEIVEEA